MKNQVPFWPVKIADNVTVCVQPTVNQMSSYILLEQEDWFEDEMRFVREFVTPEMNAFDIGANHGVYALSIAARLDNGHVWGFEPTITPGKMFEKSIELNGFNHRISWIHAGLSDHNGSVEISVSNNSELNSLYGNSGDRETIRLEKLDDVIRTNGIDCPISFVKLDAEGEEVKIIKGGEEFFSRQSPLVMFELKHGAEVNYGLIEALQGKGYKIFRLLVDLNILVPYEDSFQNDVLNLFACKTDMAEKLAARGLLSLNVSADAQNHVSGADSWWQLLQDFPYAKSCEKIWHENINDVPYGYLRALCLTMKAYDKSLPADMRAAFLAEASTITDRFLSNPTGAHFSVWLLKVHLLHLLNRRLQCVGLCQQILVSFAPTTVPAWPFLPPSAMFFNKPVAENPGLWLHSALREFFEYRKSFSSYFVSDPLPELQATLNGNFSGHEVFRRIILASIRKNLPVPAAAKQLLAHPQEILNAEIWQELSNRNG